MKDYIILIFLALNLTSCKSDDPKPEYEFGKEVIYNNHIEVEIEWNTDNARLSGTLYLPKDTVKYPTIVWVSGSGATERINYNQKGQWLRFILAKEYVDRGYAIFSYDKRGAGHSTGNFSDEMTEYNYMQLGRDALSVFSILKKYPKVDSNSVGLIGASQAGWTIPIVASTSDEIAFIAIINGPTGSTEEEDRFSRMTFDDPPDVRDSRDCCCIPLDSIYSVLESNRLTGVYNSGYNSYQDLTQMNQPCLFIQGLKDLSQPARLCVSDLNKIKNEYNKNWEIVAFEDADHYLWKGNGRCFNLQGLALGEYGDLYSPVDWQTPTFNWLNRINNR